jgi:hypothetical protein
MPFVVVGTWGHSRGDKVVHQETIHDDSLRPKYAAIKCIRYTDGTVLYVDTYDLMTPPQKLGYKELLDSSIRQGLTGTFSVMDVK